MSAMNDQDIATQEANSNIPTELKKDSALSLNRSATQLSDKLASKTAVVKLVEHIEKSVEGLTGEKEKVKAIMKFFPEVIKITRNKASAKSLLMRFAEGNLLCKLADVAMFKNKTIRHFSQLDFSEIEKCLDDKYDQTINAALEFCTPYDFRVEVDPAMDEPNSTIPSGDGTIIPEQPVAPQQIQFGKAPSVVDPDASALTTLNSGTGHNVSGPVVTMEEDQQPAIGDHILNVSKELKRSLSLNQSLLDRIETQELMMNEWQSQTTDIIKAIDGLTAENLALREDINLQGAEITQLRSDMSILESSVKALQSPREVEKPSQYKDIWSKDATEICVYLKTKGMVISCADCEIISQIGNNEAARKILEQRIGYSLDGAAGMHWRNYLNDLLPVLGPLVVKEDPIRPMAKPSTAGFSTNVDTAPSPYSQLLEKLRTSRF